MKTLRFFQSGIHISGIHTSGMTLVLNSKLKIVNGDNYMNDASKKKSLVFTLKIPIQFE